MKILQDFKFNNFFEKVNYCRKIDFLILHHVATKTIHTAIDEIKQYEVSAHYIIDLDGSVYNLVDENNIAYHSGVSYWNGIDGLNKYSIGIEFFNPNPQFNKFSQKQIKSGIKLSLDIKNRYNINSKNIIGHLDVAHDGQYNLGRKDDPSHLFDWDLFYKNNLGVRIDSEIILNLKNKTNIYYCKKRLSEYGYKILKIDDNFDKQFESIVKIILYKCL